MLMAFFAVYNIFVSGLEEKIKNRIKIPHSFIWIEAAIGIKLKKWIKNCFLER